MVLQELAQSNMWRQHSESVLHATNLRDFGPIRRDYAYTRSQCALSEEPAAERQQHGDIEQQLSAVKQDKLRIVDELKVGLCCLILLQGSRACFESRCAHACCKLAMFPLQNTVMCGTGLMLCVKLSMQ